MSTHAINPPSSEEKNLGRRGFLQAATGSFALGFFLPALSRVEQLSAAVQQTGINAYIIVGADESITILFGGCELGQGAMSGLPQIIAEELKVAWTSVKVQQADAGAISYLTGGSTAVRGNYQALRTAGAAARQMLVAAFAKTYGVPASTCKAANGTVSAVVNGVPQSMTYGALAPAAAKQPAPPNPHLTDPSKFKLIGQPLPRVDIPAKTNGSAVFGLDVRVPGMVYAAVKHCPSLGGTLAHAPKSQPGVLAIVPLKAQDSRGAVVAGSINAVAAVVATHTQGAMEAVRGLGVTWNIPSSAAQIDSAVILAQAQQLLANGQGIVAESIGDADGALAGAAHIVDSTYTLPYVPHVCMEVLNCTVNLTATSCEIWAPTQAASFVQGTAAGVTGLPAGSITVHTTFLGGGLGRKFEQDYISQAIQVAQAVGRPVKLMWPREEDFGHDQYRPMALVRVQAGLDSAGNVVAWKFRNVSESILGQRGWVQPGTLDTQASEGSTGLTYNFGTRFVDWVQHSPGVPVGFWRSVGNSINAFAVESMIDELASVAGIDPYQFRRGLLASDPRSLAVLDAAATLGGWNSPLPAGHARGIAIFSSFDSIVAQVAEISLANGGVSVLKMACAIDCGTPVNPGSIEAQMQGGIVHGLNAALWGQITFKNGAAGASNFSRYRMLRLREMPQVSVKIMPANSSVAIGGIGEPGVPPVGPVIANAYFRLTGQRLRSLPLFPAAGTQGGGG